jgi:mono/diheme cytochrome c family protein
MKKIIFSVITILLIMIAAFTAFIYSGTYNFSQLSHHNAITLWIINTTTEHSIGKRVKDIKVPPLNDTTLMAEGFVHYNDMCVMCHGSPGIDPDDMSQGLYPMPPIFFNSPDMPGAGEAFWIIQNGIKMTSMPAFGPTHSDEMIWAMTGFLLNKMIKLTPAEYQEWILKYSD